VSNEHIARLQKIGFGKETTSGTAVSAAFWLAKAKGLAVPKVEYKYDQSAYGNIDKNREAILTRKWCEVTITDTMTRDIDIGHVLMAKYGASYPCVRFPISSPSGTFVEGEVVTESTSSATGTLRRSDQSGGTPCLYIEPLSGTFTGGQTLTGGTSSATATGGTIISPSAGRHHVFRRLNSNSHPSYTIYGVDPVSADERAAYCMLDTLDLEAMADDFVKFAAKFVGQPLTSTTTQTPAYTTQNAFLGRHLAVKMASAWTGLDAASATPLERIKTQTTKGVEVVQQTGGSDPLAPTSIHNTEFEEKGDFSSLYNATTIRDLALAGTARALRFTIANTGATAVSGSTYPTLQVDYPEVYFNDWGKDDDNAKIVRQNVGFTAVYNVLRALTSEAILINTRITAY
jgi:hypothetical protein